MLLAGDKGGRSLDKAPLRRAFGVFSGDAAGDAAGDDAGKGVVAAVPKDNRLNVSDIGCSLFANSVGIDSRWELEGANGCPLS